MGSSEIEEGYVIPASYGELFDKVFPYMLSIGMSYDQFWRDDPSLVAFYLKAENHRFKKDNERMHLMGLYVFDTLTRVAPMFWEFNKKSGSATIDYIPEPYDFTAKKEEEAEEYDDLERMYDNLKFLSEKGENK